jgi:ParB family chromosome partitioning protein
MRKDKDTGLTLIPVSKLKPNPNQPRTEWDKTKDDEGKTKLQRLAQSIKDQGLLMPLIVTPQNGKMLIVSGERR